MQLLNFKIFREKEIEVEEDKVTCTTVKETKCKEKKVGYSTKEECVTWPREECSIKRQKVKKKIPDVRCIKVPTRVCA